MKPNRINEYDKLDLMVLKLSDTLYFYNVLENSNIGHEIKERITMVSYRNFYKVINLKLDTVYSMNYVIRKLQTYILGMPHSITIEGIRYQDRFTIINSNQIRYANKVYEPTIDILRKMVYNTCIVDLVKPSNIQDSNIWDVYVENLKTFMYDPTAYVNTIINSRHCRVKRFINNKADFMFMMKLNLSDVNVYMNNTLYTYKHPTLTVGTSMATSTRRYLSLVRVAMTQIPSHTLT